MMEIIQDLPEDTVGLAGKGKITHEDYQQVVIPAIEAKLKEHEKINLLFFMPDFDGMEMLAMWDDAQFGLKHWHDFSKLALVSDEAWIKNMTAFFAGMMPAEVRVFDTDEMESARNWLAGIEKQAAA